MSQLEALPVSDSPFDPSVFRVRAELRKAHWVQPSLVATIEYRQVTDAGRLRVPSFKGFRQDKAPEDCTFDQLQADPGS
jgi:bifunctional non-homologous end joining protein LigD